MDVRDVHGPQGIGEREQIRGVRAVRHGPCQPTKGVPSWRSQSGGVTSSAAEATWVTSSSPPERS